VKILVRAVQMRFIIGIWILLGLVSCASTPQSSRLLEQDSASAFIQPVNLTGVPFFPQQKYHCGPAALATVLQANQVDITPDSLVPLVYLPERQGSMQIEMLAASRSFDRIAYPLPPLLESIFKEVHQGRPVLVMQNLGLSWYPRWHYAVVVGYDLASSELLLHSGTRENYRVSLKLFERTWQRADHWAMVVLKPGELPADNDQLRYFSAVSALENARQDIDLEPAYQAGLQQWPDSSLLAMGMGMGNYFYRQGQKLDAAEQFTAVLEEDPLYAPAHNNLAQILLELGDKPGALYHAQTAVTLGGELLPAFRNTLDAILAN